MRYCLSPIDKHCDVLAMGQLDNSPDRIDAPERVGHMGHCHQPSFRSQQSFVLVKQKLAGIVDRSNPQDRTFFFTKHLPGDNIGVMLHGRDDHLVARPDVLASVRVSYQVDGFRSAADKNDLPIFSGVDESPDLGSRVLIFFGGSFTQEMNAAMNVGVLCGVVTHGGVEHDLRLLTGGRVVEVNERFTMNFLFQSREIFPDFVNIKGDTALLLSF